MRVALAHPRLFSFDGFLLVLALVVGTLGAALLFVPPEPAARPAGGVLLAAGLLVVLPRRVLAIDLSGDALTVRTVSGRRVLHVGATTRARVVEGHLLWRLFGAGLPGYHVGLFHLGRVGRVQAYCSRARGPFVLIERPDERPVLVSPADAEGFARACSGRGGRSST